MAGLLPDSESWRLGTADLIQQVAMLVWLNKGEEHKDLMKTVTQGRVMYELYNRLSPEKQLDTFQTQCILSIVAYIKKHPKASEAELVKEITKQVEVFKENTKNL